jgi:hypothetical protein
MILGAVNTDVVTGLHFFFQDVGTIGEKYFDMLEHYFSADLTDCGLIGKYLCDLRLSKWWI